MGLMFSGVWYFRPVHPGRYLPCFHFFGIVGPEKQQQFLLVLDSRIKPQVLLVLRNITGILSWNGLASPLASVVTIVQVYMVVGREIQTL